MAKTPEDPTLHGEQEDQPEAEEKIAATARPSVRASASAQGAVQPEGVMAADEGEAGGPVPAEPFPWDKVIKWGLVIAGITVVLYLIFRKKDD